MSGRKIWKIIRNILLVLVGLVAAFFLLFVPWFFTHFVTTHQYHFHDPNDGKTPASFGMKDNTTITFPATDGIPLKGWFAPEGSNPRGTIIFCHGLNRSRVEMLPMAGYAHGLGFDALLFDFRHQGASGGKITTLGYQERLDAEGAVRYALNDLKAPRPIILWGISMGAATALMAAADSSDIAAVISDSSWTTFHELIAHHAKLFMRLPSFPIPDEIEYGIALRGHFWPSDFNLIKAVQKIGTRPILFVAVKNDRRMPPAYAEALYAASSSPEKAIVVVEGKRHGEGFNSGREPYEVAVRKFLDQVAPPAAAAPPENPQPRGDSRPQ
ncbi:MAG TPA: alpha/beta hydrolase [Terriglobia bacterium]|nr:alpha/beta hydrolase [Terriglobia bacterium]